MEYSKSCILLSILTLLILDSSTVSADRVLEYSSKKVQHIEGNFSRFWNIVFFNQLNGYDLSNSWKKIEPRIKEDVSEKCRESVDSLINDWRWKESSVRLFSSTGFAALPAGILSQTTVELGDYDQCIATKDERSKWIGQYCVGTLNIPRSKLFSPTNFSRILVKQPNWQRELIQKWYDFDNHYSLARGFCSPSSCNSAELQTILQHSFPVLKSLDFQVQFCQTSDFKPRDPRAWIPGILLGFSVLMILFSRVYCFLVLKKRDCKLDSMIRAFDPVENTQKLFNISVPEVTSGKAHLGVLDGIRVIGMAFLICLHVSMYGFITQINILAVRHFPTISQNYLKLFGLFYPNPQGVLSVFMLMSAILLSYTSLRKGSLKENFLVFVFRRWARFLPGYVGCVCFYLLLQYTGNGPLYHEDILAPQTGTCYQYWWRQILLIHNLFDMRDHCIQSSWFIACEFQLRILFFSLLYLYSRHSPKWTLVGAVALAVAGIAIRIGIMLNLNMITTMYAHMFPEYSLNTPYYKVIYGTVFQFMEVYSIGFIIGQWLLEKRKFKFTVTKTALFVGLGAWGHFAESWKFYRSLKEHSGTLVQDDPSLIDVFSHNIHFVMFNLFIGYLIYYLIQHPNIIVSRFLSHPIFLPFSRLTFSVYLIHMVLIVHTNFQARSPISFDNINLLNQQFHGMTMYSYLMGFLVYLLFEAPWDRIVRIFRNDKKPITNTDQELEAVEKNDLNA